MDSLDSIIGKVSRIIYHHPETFFTVMRFTLYELGEKQLFVTGYFPVFEKDTQLEIFGSYQEHPRYGMQFVAQSFKKIVATDEISLIRFLSSPLFAGIGKKTAELIVASCGLDVIERLQQNPLPHINGVKAEKIEYISYVLKQTGQLEQAIAFFTMHGLSVRQVMKIDRVYGEVAIEQLSENPYRLVEEVDGIGFKIADKLGASLGFEVDHPYRIQASLLDLCMSMHMKTKDTYIDYDAFYHTASNQWQDVDITYSLESLIREHKLVLEENRLYHHSQYEAEIAIAEYFKTNQPDQELFTIDHLDEKLDAIQKANQISYDITQLEAIKTFLKQPHLIITGGPGTGKTTIVMAIIQLLKMAQPPLTIESVAPTGRAAKRLSALTNHKASTIHSLLNWDLETNTFGKNKEYPVLADVLIIDEFSMVDSFLFSKLSKAIKPIKKVLILGDKDQLPSVGPGQVLYDLLESGVIESIALTNVYRQQAGSAIIDCALDFLEGKIRFDYQQDIQFIPSVAALAKNHVIKAMQQALDDGYQMDDIMVLAPKYSGFAGIDTLNHALQKAFNPPSVNKAELVIGYKIFREQDKVLQLKNQPDDDVYNGDIGMIVEIIDAKDDHQNQHRIIVDFQGQFVEYTSDTFDRITLAYCTSVHKAQGNEFAVVIVLALGEYGWMLQKRLYYTAITRAAKSLVLIGEKSAFEKAAANEHSEVRQSTLKQRLMIE